MSPPEAWGNRPDARVQAVTLPQNCPVIGDDQTAQSKIRLLNVHLRAMVQGCLPVPSCPAGDGLHGCWELRFRHPEGRARNPEGFSSGRL